MIFVWRYPVYARTFKSVEPWFPGAAEAWKTVGCDWPMILRAMGTQLSANDERCWIDLHKDTCECRVWNGSEWERWIKRP